MAQSATKRAAQSNPSRYRRSRKSQKKSTARIKANNEVLMKAKLQTND